MPRRRHPSGLSPLSVEDGRLTAELPGATAVRAWLAPAGHVPLRLRPRPCQRFPDIGGRRDGHKSGVVVEERLVSSRRPLYRHARGGSCGRMAVREACGRYPIPVRSLRCSRQLVHAV